jgi:serralysin
MKNGLGRVCALGVVLSVAMGCGSKSGDGASSAAPSGSVKAAGSNKTAGSSGASGAGSSGPVAGGKPRVAHEMSAADACVHADPSEDGAKMISADETNWPNGSTIVVGFLNGEKEWIDNVQEAADEWSDYANIKFEWHKDPANVPDKPDELVTFKDCEGWYVRGKGGGAGPASTYFPKQGKFSVCLAAWPAYLKHGKLADARASAVHEFGHVIGLHHEQFNPNLKVTWDKDYLYEWCQKTQNWDKENCDRQIMMPLTKLKPDYHWRTTEFDKDSIMFYGIQDPNWTMERVTFPEPTKISELDKKTIALIYPKGADKDPTDPAQAAMGYDLETQIKKLGEKDVKQQYVIAVGVAEKSERDKVEGVTYIFPPEIVEKPVAGDAKHEQYIVKGKISVSPTTKTFKVRARIKLKDGSSAIVDKEFNLGSADGTGGDLTTDDE